MTKKIAVVVGSLRKESFTRKIALQLIKLAPSSLNMKIFEIGQLPLYNQDLDTSAPEEWAVFRRDLHDVDGFLFATPEYNRSVPGVLKNAIDVGSRPYGQSVWSGKPAGIISVSPGAVGGFGSNHHLRQSLVFLDMPALQQPEAYIGNAGSLFDANGKVTNETTVELMKKFMQAFAKWVELNIPSKK